MAVQTLLDIRKAVIPICKKYDVKRLYVFGSFSREEQHDSSDVDLILECPSVKDYTTLFEIKEELSTALQRPVDLFDMESIARSKEKNLKANIMDDKIMVYP